MKIKPFFVVFPVLVGVVIYGYFTAEEKPEGAANLTPKEYIELVEQQKAERLKKEAADQAKAASDQKTEAVARPTPATPKRHEK
jgi:hypothetical protein